MMIILTVACAMHRSKLPQTCMNSPGTIGLADIPISPCAMVAAVAGAPGFCKPVDATEYQVVTFNWGAYPVVDYRFQPAENGWIAIATKDWVEPGSLHRSIIFVRAMDMTYDVSQSTMSPGDAEENDWSLCTNTPRGY